MQTSHKSGINYLDIFRDGAVGGYAVCVSFLNQVPYRVVLVCPGLGACLAVVPDDHLAREAYPSVLSQYA